LDAESNRRKPPSAGLNIANATIADLNRALTCGAISSSALVASYVARIEAYDRQGPRINSLIYLNKAALKEAAQRDRERAMGQSRGPLHGIPIVLKDNFDAAGMPTTAGSRLLAGHLPSRDAFVVKRLRDAGAIILAKTNMQEFAGGGGSVMGSRERQVLQAGTVPSGYSTQGGQTLNPHDVRYSPSSSSGGTGAAVAAAFAQFGLGTDTIMSIRGPGSVNGIVGLKPTNGLLSRSGIVPLAPSLDTAGPMARNIYDTAFALGVMAGVDATDPSTARDAPPHGWPDYIRGLRKGALRDSRFGVVQQFLGTDPEVDEVFHSAVSKMREKGATVMEVRYPDYLLDMKEGLCSIIMASEFRAHIADYLASTGTGFPKSLAELAAAAADPRRRYPSPEKAYALRYTEEHALDLDDPGYLAARHHGMALVRHAVDALFARHELDALLYPTLSGTAPRIAAAGTAAPTPYLAMPPSHHSTVIANLSGYPDLTIPIGRTIAGLPVGMSIFGRAHAEAKLLAYGYDLERPPGTYVLPRHTPALESDVLL